MEYRLMNSRIILDKVKDTIWPEGFSIDEIRPPTKVLSILEVVGVKNEQISAISYHCKYLAVVGNTTEELCPLHIINLHTGRSFILKKLRHPCVVLQFYHNDEAVLLAATTDNEIFYINIESGDTISMIGHKSPILGIGYSPKGSIMSYSQKEVLLWASDTLHLHSRMKVDPGTTVVWADTSHLKKELIVGFRCGTVIVWGNHEYSEEVVMKPPPGVSMIFNTYALSRSCEWLIGGGNKQVFVTYSMINRRSSQVIHLPNTCPDIQTAFFLPPILPKYSQVLLLLSSNGAVNVVDHATTTKIKTLKSHQFNIESACISEDGYLLGITYSNCVTKLYTLSSFFPPATKVVKDDQFVAFKVLEEHKRTEQQRKKEKTKKDVKHTKDLLDPKKWYPILQEYGEYPSKYRISLWTSTLQLPRNFSVVSDLLKKGTHPAFQDLHSSMSAEVNAALFKDLQKILSCLVHWAPFLIEVDYLPKFIFPFVKLLHSNLVLCFEVVATIILNFCRFWFEFWPQPSITVLNLIEQLLCDNSPHLLTHLIQLNITSREYAWPLLTSALSEILSKDDWLVLWDHLVSNPPTLLPCVVVSLLVTLRPTLLSCSTTSEVLTILKQETWISTKRVVSKAYKIHESLPKDQQPFINMRKLVQLPSDGLPVFNIGPPNDVKRPINNVEMEESPRDVEVIPQRTKELKKLQIKSSDEPATSNIDKKGNDCINTIFNLRKRHLNIK